MRSPSKTVLGGGHWGTCLEAVADPVRLQILRSLSRMVDASAADLATYGQASYQTMRRHLEAMVALGVIRERAGESDGQTPGRPASRFSLQPEIRESVRRLFGTFPGSTPAPPLPR